MSTGEAAYLAMVVAAFIVFAVTVGSVSVWSSRRPKE